MSEIIPSRPIFSSGNKADSSAKKNTKKRKKNVVKGKVGAKKKKNLNKRVKKENNAEKEPEDSDLDLEKELLSIGSYINDRDLMVEHVFKSVTGPKLQTLLPDILKNIPVNELSEMCYHQLEGMSKKRIRHIIAGEEMNSSSGTEESFSDDGQTGNKDKLEPRTRDTSPDTSTVVHSTCDSQGDGDMSVGSTQDGAVDTGLSIDEEETQEVQEGPEDASAILVGGHSPINSGDDEEGESKEDEEMEEESVTSEEMEDGSEEGEVRSSRQEEEAGPSRCMVKDENSGPQRLKDLTESGNFNEEGEDEWSEIDERECITPKNTDTAQLSPQGEKINVNKTDQSEGSKPSSELEILELELRARAIRSLMQKFAQNKEQK